MSDLTGLVSPDRAALIESFFVIAEICTQRGTGSVLIPSLCGVVASFLNAPHLLSCETIQNLLALTDRQEAESTDAGFRRVRELGNMFQVLNPSLGRAALAQMRPFIKTF